MTDLQMVERDPAGLAEEPEEFFEEEEFPEEDDGPEISYPDDMPTRRPPADPPVVTNTTHVELTPADPTTPGSTQIVALAGGGFVEIWSSTPDGVHHSVDAQIKHFRIRPLGLDLGVVRKKVLQALRIILIAQHQVDNRTVHMFGDH